MIGRTKLLAQIKKIRKVTAPTNIKVIDVSLAQIWSDSLDLDTKRKRIEDERNREQSPPDYD